MSLSIKQVSVSSAAASDWIEVDPRRSQGRFGLVLLISGTATATVQFTLDPPGSSANAIDHDILDGITTSTASDLGIPVRAIRVNCTSYSSGTVTLIVASVD